MLRIEELPGGLRRFRMRKVLAGRPMPEVSAWWVPPGVLVDAGPVVTATELVEALRPTPPKAILVTHHHEDHVGGLPALAAAFGVTALAGATTVEILAKPRRIPLYRALVWGAPIQVVARAIPGPRFELEGLVIEAIPSPGHAWDHLCYWLPQRHEVLSGDLYVHPRVVYLRRIEDPWSHIASLRELVALEPEALLCAHAGRVTPAVPALASKIQHWESLAESATALARAGLGVDRIARRLLGRDGAFRWLSAGDFSKRNLIEALLRGPGVGTRE